MVYFREAVTASGPDRARQTSSSKSSHQREQRKRIQPGGSIQEVHPEPSTVVVQIKGSGLAALRIPCCISRPSSAMKEPSDYSGCIADTNPPGYKPSYDEAWSGTSELKLLSDTKRPFLKIWNYEFLITNEVSAKKYPHCRFHGYKISLKMLLVQLDKVFRKKQ